MSLPGVLGFCLLSLVISAASAAAVNDSPSHRSPSCLPDQRARLLQFKKSLSIAEVPCYWCPNTSYPKTLSWGEKDCCSWEGVTCDAQTGVIVGLDLSCSLLVGTLDSNSSLFSLRNLRNLSLASNYLFGSLISPEIGNFPGMMHLNLSWSGFWGAVPAEMSLLSKLVTLDLSGNFWGSGLVLRNPTLNALVRNLTELDVLDLTYLNMSAVNPAYFANLSSSLGTLKLSGCLLRGQLPYSIFQLPNLRTVDLSFNRFLGGILPRSNWSSSLVSLSLSHTYFTGEIPRSMGNLTQLMLLDLSWTNLTGYIDIKTFSTLENLRVLDLSGASVSGDYAMDEHQSFPKLEKLTIAEGRLINFPCFMSSMPELREMTLESSVIAEISSQCDTAALLFPQLEELNMQGCNSTEFPFFLSRSEGLRTLDLSGNKVRVIPDWFWHIGIDTLEFLNLDGNLVEGRIQLPWRKLLYLSLQNNLFEGPLPIPSPHIETFYASHNRFNGNISPQLCELTSLLQLSLGQNNLTGFIPRCLGNLTGLNFVSLSNNSLTGRLPRSLANCTSLSILDVSFNNIIDTPPVWLTTASLKELYLQSNKFRGRWPTDFFLKKSLLALDLSNNNFEGSPPCPSDITLHYIISSNNFSGEIGSCVCNSVYEILDMSNNGLTGNLPLCLKNTTPYLNYLGLQKNKLRGSIPEICSDSSTDLRVLDLSSNRFEGQLPRSLLKCQNLEVLDVSGNMIVDSFPDWLQDLPFLKVLSLRSNKFHGGVSSFKDALPFSQLRILDLSQNSLDGYLPDNLIARMVGMMQVDDTHNDSTYMGSGWNSEYLNFSTSRFGGSSSQKFYSLVINLKGVETEMKINVGFATLDLSSNSFHGELPSSLGSLVSLKGLNLSHNVLTGSIPPSLGNLTNLESLDLSANLLVGEIPRELAQLSFLGFLNLSRNNLTGQIPTGGHLNTFPIGSFEGNPGLCGLPFTRGCGGGGAGKQWPSSERREDGTWRWLEWKLVGMGFGSGVVIGISMGFIVLETGRPLWLARMALRLEAKFKNKPKKRTVPGRGP